MYVLRITGVKIYPRMRSIRFYPRPNPVFQGFEAEFYRRQAYGAREKTVEGVGRRPRIVTGAA
jgi:hypothetical protein